ncbi:MAG TPA: CoA transferase [Microbacteriaceae bacterium]|nr:CoA transferase [Microbacteriaceae bacterium]
MDTPVQPVLQGIRVADFSRVLAGPYATMMLADFGADVIKIESPAGDDTRDWLPPVDADGDSTYFASVNRNKRSVVCDLKTPEGLARAREIALGADVVIENFRTGVMAKFGLDAATLRAENPALVYCHITGFGDGEGAALPGYDLLVQAVGGLMSITGPSEGEPSKVGVALVDVLTGLNALTGILLALRERDRTGLGDVVRVDLLTSLLSGLVNQASGTLATGVAPGRSGNAHPSITPYELFDGADRPLVIAAGNDRQFTALCHVLDERVGPALPALGSDERYATNPQRVAARDSLRVAINERLAFAPAQDWVTAFMAVGVPAGLVNSVKEAIEFAAELGLDPIVSLPKTTGTVTSLVRNPIRLDHSQPVYRSAPPALGADQDTDWRPRP